MDPLVSIIVVTYNSSKFVEETLNSIKTQTWPELELIITDDCSQDSTVEICQEWLAKNQSRFSRTQLITTPVNTGISANGNRGLKAAKGEWLKAIAGDDALFPNCIEDNMNFIRQNPKTRVLFSYARVYAEAFEEKNFIGIIPGQSPTNIINDSLTAADQYKILLLSDRITFTPSNFIHLETQMRVGGLNEKVKMQEDYPLWLSLTKAGYKLYFMEKETVKYRKHEKSTNNMMIDYLIRPNYFRTEDFRREYIYPNLPWDIRWERRFVWYSSQIFRLDKINRNHRLNRILYAILTVWCNPLKYYLYIKKKTNPNLKNNEFYN